MVIKTSKDAYTICDIGVGDGFWEVSRSELEMLKCEIEGIIVAEDIKEE